ncbi:MAG: type I 3-dehydroquinate dehydratase [Lactobacillales bacterium]|jgi:3-dehydroquinate dehydratase-1|nr:type I 3-dehydroquinate dehydratase [Lactobacillales bacterium]
MTLNLGVITADDEKSAIKIAKKIANNSAFDGAEFRIDFLLTQNLNKIIDLINELKSGLGRKKLLVTWRTLEEGGEKSLEDIDYFNLIKLIYLNTNADYLDIELKKAKFYLIRDLLIEHPDKMRLVISFHNFNKPLVKKEIEDLFEAMELFDADKAVKKIAMVEGASLAQKVLEERSDDIALIPMGVDGKPVRRHVRQYFNFINMNKKENLGQWKYDELK